MKYLITLVIVLALTASLALEKEEGYERKRAILTSVLYSLPIKTTPIQ